MNRGIYTGSDCIVIQRDGVKAMLAVGSVIAVLTINPVHAKGLSALEQSPSRESKGRV